jgi:endonuclease-3
MPAIAPKKKKDALPRKSAAKKARARKIFDELLKLYPDAHCELDYRSPHELLVATILSAQATDVGVNKATPALFAKFPTPADYAKAKPQEIEPYIRSLGFFRQKSKSVHAAMSMIVDEFGGKVPDRMDDLLKLRGVARKTANVVLGNAFGINEGVVVDTHVIRLANRFGLSKHTDPEKIERDLIALFPAEQWCMLSHLLIWHGRRVCKARNGLCSQNAVCRKYCSNARAAGKK